MFPEDLGGHSYSGPSFPWALQDWRYLEGLGEAKRESAFLCRLADADHRRPTGVITNLDTLINDLYLGWPSLLPIQLDLYYDGPLPKVFPCVTLHGDLVGLGSARVFLSAGCPVIPVGLWCYFFEVSSRFAAHRPLGLRNLFPRVLHQVFLRRYFSDALIGRSWLLVLVVRAMAVWLAYYMPGRGKSAHMSNSIYLRLPRLPSARACLSSSLSSPPVLLACAQLWACRLLSQVSLVLVRPRSLLLAFRRVGSNVSGLRSAVESEPTGLPSRTNPSDAAPRKVPRMSECLLDPLELKRQESQRSERQLQPISFGSGDDQNSEAIGQEGQMGRPGSRGHHLGTDALLWTRERGELIPGGIRTRLGALRSLLLRYCVLVALVFFAPGTAFYGEVTSSSTTRPRTSGSTKSPLGPSEQGRNARAMAPPPFQLTQFSVGPRGLFWVFPLLKVQSVSFKFWTNV